MGMNYKDKFISLNNSLLSQFQNSFDLESCRILLGLNNDVLTLSDRSLILHVAQCMECFTHKKIILVMDIDKPEVFIYMLLLVLRRAPVDVIYSRSPLDFLVLGNSNVIKYLSTLLEDRIVVNSSILGLDNYMNDKASIFAVSESSRAELLEYVINRQLRRRNIFCFVRDYSKKPNPALYNFIFRMQVRLRECPEGHASLYSLVDGGEN